MIFELFKVCLHVAKTSDFFNSFAVIDDQSDWNSDSLGKTYDQSRIGTWWTRRGINHNENSKMYPCLALQWRNSPLEDWQTGQVKHEIYIAVVQQKIDRDGELTWEEIDYKNTVMLLSVLKRIMDYRLQPDGSWNHPDFGYSGNCKMQKYIEVTKGQDIFQSLLGVDGLRTKTMRFLFTECLDTSEAKFDNEFSYNEEGMIGNIPAKGGTEISSAFEPVIIYDGDGNEIAQLGSGETFVCAGVSFVTITINGQEWATVAADHNIEVVNTQDDFLGAKIGSKWVVGDMDIEIYTDGDLQFSGSVVVGGTQTINVDLV